MQSNQSMASHGRRLAAAVLIVSACGLPATWAEDADDLGYVSGIHDGRRGPENPYIDRISDEARLGVSGSGDRGAVRSSRYALMSKPLKTAPVPPDPAPEPPAQASSRTDTDKTSPAKRGRENLPPRTSDRPTLFDH